MTHRKALARLLIAALLAATAGPAMAKSQAKQQGSGEVSATQKQRQSAKTCRRNPPPFMHNPRFMNRGFFKRKCNAQDQ